MMFEYTFDVGKALQRAVSLVTVLSFQASFSKIHLCLGWPVSLVMETYCNPVSISLNPNPCSN